ncbi:hypothetical protein GCM10011352_26710 [Marinobacterium zhoushanense]|uniref:YdhG-like domain-containing protein n=1 Tax=Marinobacterium zhoushanense TaxID=1679163 RepID=A0ABQ1KK13_9GAMM|nr:YdeI family protein [Marinobacterium zhoushanense]GGB99190.1 hypothetical protein GCM10011352_26710 [Marinobacterium zhoushanense]
MNAKVEAFLSKADKWQQELERLRAIVLDCRLDEGLKWGKPCYSVEDRNVVLIHGFKDYCALLFMKGALLKDAEGLLVAQTENVQSARQIRFTSVAEIEAMAPTLKRYIDEAIEVERSGRKVAFKQTDEFDVPEELQERFDRDPAFKSAFEALTPGRQRGYLLYFSTAKQSKTREMRIERSRQKIIEGKGPSDR